MLGWLKRVLGWEEEEEEPRGWPALFDLDDEEAERMKALLADWKSYRHMTWEEFREYIRSQGLPPPPPRKHRYVI